MKKEETAKRARTRPRGQADRITAGRKTIMRPLQLQGACHRYATAQGNACEKETDWAQREETDANAMTCVRLIYYTSQYFINNGREKNGQFGSNVAVG